MTLISAYDVLCGKDKTYENHVGNKLYRDLVVQAAPQYITSTTKQDKMQMTRDIVSTLTTRYGSRFMKVSPMHGGWEEISMAAARDKTSHALRFCATQMEGSLLRTSPSISKRGQQPKRKNQPKIKQTIRRKVSFDETKRSKCISPYIPEKVSSYQFQTTNMDCPATESFHYNDIVASESLVTWCVPNTNATTGMSSIHDLSTEIDYFEPQQNQQRQNNKTILPFTASSTTDIDLLWSYQLDGDDEFVLDFEV